MRLGNPESFRWTGYRYFVIASIQTPKQLRPLTTSYLKKTLREFAFNLVYVILSEPVSVETESGNFLALKVFTDANKTIMIHPCSNILASVHKDIAVLIDE